MSAPRKQKILVVDDEEFIRDFLKEVLESEGHIFVSARNGDEALDRLKEDRPDVILLDIEMPKINGLEVLRQIREKEKNLPVVILTAYSSTERVKQAIALDVSGFIPKGVSVKDTISKIKTVLNINIK